jgi:hypothetical protein
MFKYNRYVYHCIRAVSRSLPYSRRLKELEQRYRRRLIRSKFIDRIPLKGYIISARTDGLLARINSIFNGVVLSKHYNTPFIFTWATGEGAELDKFSCISSTPISFISQQFLEKHYMDERIVRKCAMPWHKTIANCSIVTATTIAKKIPHKEFKKQMAEYHNVLANCQSSRRYSQDIAMNKEIFEHFFSPAMKDKFSAIQSMRDWKQWIAIHYRAGDVIYGRCRLGKYVRCRSLSLPVVEKAIRDNHDKKIVIMGTPHDDSLDELILLEKKYPNVELSPEITSSNASHNPTSTLCDAYLMSLCKKVICAGNSNMTQFAKRLSGVDIHIPSVEEQKTALEASLASGEAFHYTRMQQAFIHYNMFMIDFDDPECSHEKADGYLRQIRELDPENMAILLLRFLIAKKHGRLETANQIKGEIQRNKCHAIILSKQLKPNVVDKLNFQYHLGELLEMEV